MVIRGLGYLVRLAGWLRTRHRLVLAGAWAAAGVWSAREIMRGMSAHRDPAPSRGLQMTPTALTEARNAAIGQIA